MLNMNCAADPDFDTSPGSCSISCSDAKIGSNDMRIRFIFPEGDASPLLPLRCFNNADTVYPKLIPIQFVFEKPRRILPAEQIGGDGDTVIGGSGGELGERNNAQQWVPVSGVGFRPVLIAGEVPNINDVGDEFYNGDGVSTPEEEWCTDSCGVGTINVRANCVAQQINNVQFGIISGSLNNIVKINLQQP